MRTVRRLISVGFLVLVAAAVSGCVVRPLGWGHHGGHGYRDGGYRSDSLSSTLPARKSMISLNSGFKSQTTKRAW